MKRVTSSEILARLRVERRGTIYLDDVAVGTFVTATTYKSRIYRDHAKIEVCARRLNTLAQKLSTEIAKLMNTGKW